MTGQLPIFLLVEYTFNILCWLTVRAVCKVYVSIGDVASTKYGQRCTTNSIFVNTSFCLIQA